MQTPRWPEVVEEYARRCSDRGVGRAAVEPAGTRLQQSGSMRLGEHKPWMEFRAEQQIETRRCEFVWRANFHQNRLVWGVVEDAFEDGRGRLDVKLWNWLRVAKDRGPMVDRGEVQRYLAELPWCPRAMVCNPDLHFRARTHERVEVWRGTEATSVELLFDTTPKVVEVFAERRPRGKVLQSWRGRFFDYRDFAGLHVPSRAEVGWESRDGSFVYWRGEVTQLGIYGSELSLGPQ